MRSLTEIVENTSEPVPRPVRRRIGTAVVILLTALFAWAVFKHVATGNLAESEIDAGLDDVARALQTGEGDAYDSAEKHFLDAASVTIASSYPAFLITTERRLRKPNPAGDIHDRIAAAIVASDFEHARQLVRELGEKSAKAADFWTRFLDELQLRLH